MSSRRTIRARRAGRRRRTIVLSSLLASIALLYVLAVLITRVLPLNSLLTLVLAATSPYVPLVAALGLTLAALHRRKLLSLVGGVLLITTIALQVQWYYVGDPSQAGAHTPIRVLSSNLRHGQADAGRFVGLAASSADIITVSELTAEAVTRFREAGIRKTFPYSILIARPGAEGMGLWSRYPLTGLRPPKYANNFIAARVRVPGVRNNPLVASVHLMSPLAGGADTFGEWNDRITAARSEFADYAQTAGPAAVIIAGDFNATPDMRQFRDLLDVGYRDAVNQTGAGFSPTYSPHPAIPPLITIDHVLTRNSTAQSIRAVDIPRSDHRALLATIEVPEDPSAP